MSSRAAFASSANVMFVNGLKHLLCGALEALVSSDAVKDEETFDGFGAEDIMTVIDSCKARWEVVVGYYLCHAAQVVGG
jgi:hypothetical protein